jgi:hypothetical protein
MAVWAEQEMADFVCDGAAQNYGDRVITLGETPRIFVVDTSESRREDKAEEGVLQPTLDVAWKYPEHYIDRLSRLVAQLLWVGGRVVVKAV